MLLEDKAQALVELSQTDELSGLNNRRVLNKELSRELNRSRRYGGTFILMMLDVDHFKSLNDQYGHLYGDTAIKKIATLLKEESRDTDCCIRYGGDEFVILLPNTHANHGIDIAHRLKEKIANTGGELHLLTASIGLAIVDKFDIEEACIIDLADQCVYQAKENGRNNVVWKNV